MDKENISSNANIARAQVTDYAAKAKGVKPTDRDNNLWDEERRRNAASSAEYEKQQAEMRKQHDDAIVSQINDLLGKNDFNGARNAANGIYDQTVKNEYLNLINEKEAAWKRGEIEGVSNSINEAVESANRATDTAAYKTATDDLNRYSSRSRAQSAQMSSNDDAQVAAAFTDENLLNNRKTAFMNAVTAGAEKLKALGEQDVANNLIEAGKLQANAQTLTSLSQGIDATLSTVAGLLK